MNYVLLGLIRKNKNKELDMVFFLNVKIVSKKLIKKY
jgi:hypothetical protein